jgi:hypothetical protein
LATVGESVVASIAYRTLIGPHCFDFLRHSLKNYFASFPRHGLAGSPYVEHVGNACFDSPFLGDFS